MLLNIIFSYNRAMQLDLLLQSILKRFRIENYEIAILYHTTGKHREGYDLLKNQYLKYNFIKFYERKEGFDVLSYLPSMSGFWNLKNFYKYHLINKKRDNFKGLLEKLLFLTDYEYVMFNTDDGFFYGDLYLDNDCLNLIKNNPREISYRNYLGDNILEFPAFVKPWGNNYLWDYYHDGEVTHWKFPFAVDGTIYNSKGILSILKRIAYHNPVTLEDFGVTYVVSKKFFGVGLSPLKSCLVCTKLNRVSVDSSNPTIHIKPEFLNEKYINGYKLEIELPEIINNSNLVPERITLIKNDLRELIYELDDFGRNVQNNLGAEGARVQMD